MNWLKQLIDRRRESNSLSEEISEHLQEKVEFLIAGGMSRAQAESAARREFGNVLLLEERGREVWEWTTLEAILRDLKYALRQLRRNPGFTLTVLLTLTLAIGVNTGVFTMLNALILRPLPYPQPDRLGSLVTHHDGFNGRGIAVAEDDNSSDGETWEMVRDNVPAVMAGATSSVAGVNLRAGDSVRYVREQRVSAGYFETLGVPPLFGRSFTAEEDKPNGPKVVILSYELWQSVLSSDPQAIGKTITLKGEPHTLVGVLPPHTETTDKADLWTPLRPSPSGEGEGSNYGVILRLRKGATWTQANAQLAPLRPTLLRNLQSQQPRGHIWLFAIPWQQGFAREHVTPVYILMAAVAFILLIASANLAGLMLVRTTRRSAEIATRLALGATHASVLRQLMMEPLLLCLLGGALGLLVAAKGLNLLTRLVPPSMIPVGGISIDYRVLAFAALISLFSNLLISLLPALDLRRMDLTSAMTVRTSRSGSQGVRRRTRQLLITGEVTLTVVLLAGAGLLIRTLVHLQTLPPGFDASSVMTAQLSLDDARYHNAPAFQKLLQQSVDAMKRIPGVESAAVGLSLPFERGLNDGFQLADGPDAGTGYMSSVIYVTPEYFRVLRIPLLAGRAFTESDTSDSEQVVIVNSLFAQQFFHSTDVVGRHLRLGKTTAVIVGVVGDVTKEPGLVQTAPLSTEVTYYFPATQVRGPFLGLLHVWFQPSWVVRTQAPVSGLTEAMTKAMAEADPGLPFAGFHRLEELQGEALSQQRFEVLLLGGLAALALLLSLVGIYGLVSNLVVQRTREIGIRMALGSNLRQAMMEVGFAGVVPVVFGLASGLVLSSLTVRVVQSELYGVKTYDPLTFAAVIALLAVAATAAVFLPTRRIAQIDPAATLRAE